MTHSTAAAMAAAAARRLTYCADSGRFTWIAGQRAGRVAGTLRPDGYRQIRLCGESILEHRLVWLYVHGAWPENDVDHRNGDRGDNRLANLRAATRAENKQNENAAHRDSSTGLRGVSWNEAGQAWDARICRDRRTHHLGLFPSPEAAHQAYRRAKAVMHPYATDRS